MKVKRDGTTIHIALEGALGETSDFFTLPVKDFKQIYIDMANFTFINSIGVKNWVVWTLKLPVQGEVKLLNVPLVIASQASMALGFLTPKMKVESMRLPYVCNKCHAEVVQNVSLGKDYEYAGGGLPARITLPKDIPCAKCAGGILEPDFIVGKTLRFLG